MCVCVCVCVCMLACVRVRERGREREREGEREREKKFDLCQVDVLVTICRKCAYQCHDLNRKNPYVYMYVSIHVHTT